MKTEESAWSQASTLLNTQFIPKTVQEIRALIALRPEHPVCLNLQAAVRHYPESIVCYLLPVTIEAIEKNCSVIETYTMQQTAHPVTGKPIWKKIKQILLGPSLESSEVQQ